ncbi:hypothetical protein [Cellvibrio sp. NN19]|uniref:hypothetical protein n=1 Tax=Cellvibrio chitinivorans TaxID=3102792 RepID=UPI002B40C025|nr:hypothetical protein [Cellvibrio sp. NN19]
MIHNYTDKTMPVGVLLNRIIQRLGNSADGIFQTQHLAIQFTHNQYYLPQQSATELVALLIIRKNKSNQLHIEGSIFPFTSERWAKIQQLPHLASDDETLHSFVKTNLLPWLVMSDPWVLSPVHVPKPWGQEIWYTGIEARGQAGVVCTNGIIPLPWLLDVMSGQIGLGQDSPPVLLKVLDPVAEEVYGDLYFELHQKKQEVYVVTHLNQSAWRDGVGAIQLGFSTQARAQYKNDDAFKRAYLQAVQSYERVRRLIDTLLDEKKRDVGLDLSEPASSSDLMIWINELSQSVDTKGLIEQEQQLRQVMNSFVEHYPLRLGDVVTVPKLVPHALQHGVRVVEFQTPVYERKILSFGQKVLTQSHWDTEEALKLADMNFTQLPTPEILVETLDYRIERIVNFDDFEVKRVWLDGNYHEDSGVYSVLMTLDGELVIGQLGSQQEVNSGQAILMPKSGAGWFISSRKPSLFLLATPKSSPK